jgi:hypothetical protein
MIRWSGVGGLYHAAEAIPKKIEMGFGFDDYTSLPVSGKKHIAISRTRVVAE